MQPFSLVITTLLSLLLSLAPVTTATPPPYEKPLTLDRALRKYCLGKYADFIIKYPTPETNGTDIVVFAPTNKAVKEYILANPDPFPDVEPEPEVKSTKLNKRADPAKNAANRNNVAQGTAGVPPFGSLPPKGAVLASGTGGTSGAKVAKAVPAAGTRKRGDEWDGHKYDCAYDYHAYQESKPVGTITAGGGGVTEVLSDQLKFKGGIIYVVGNFFSTTGGAGDLIQNPEIDYLNKVFFRLPEYKEKIFGAEKLTFLVPNKYAFHKAGLSEYKSPKKVLAEFLEDHIILNGFLGYTPNFVDGKCYKTKSWKGFVPIFNGTHTTVNDAVIVGEDRIVDNGVIQIIDKVLHSGKKGYQKQEACKKGWYGN